MEVLIRCAHEQGRRAPQIVVDPGTPNEKRIDVEEGDVRDFTAKEARTSGVFEATQGPTLQAFTLLLWLVLRRNGKLDSVKKWPFGLTEAKPLKGWRKVTTEGAVKAAVARIIGDSCVLEQTNGRARIRPGIKVEIEGTADEQKAILRWAGIELPASSATEPTTPPPGPASAPHVDRGAPEDGPVAADLTALRAKIEALLERARFLAVALAKELHLADEPGELSLGLARALLRTSGKDIANILASLDATLDRDRDVLRALLWEILPLTVEWRTLVAQTRAALQSGIGALELPLRTETIAEIILAGADGRPCQFAPGAVIPEGVAHVALPALAHAPFFDGKGEMLVQAVVMNLGKEGELGEKVWGPYLKKYPRYLDFKTIVDRKLTASKKDGLSHYLLVIDAIIDPDQKRDVDTSWAIARDAFGKALPGLRLVRLTGRSAEALGEEFDFADPIKKVRDAL